jgi:hypothetical protein
MPAQWPGLDTGQRRPAVAFVPGTRVEAPGHRQRLVGGVLQQRSRRPPAFGRTRYGHGFVAEGGQPPHQPGHGGHPVAVARGVLAPLPAVRVLLGQQPQS